MKSLLVTIAFFTSIYASAGTLSCATGIGSYNEVEKFQIIDKQSVKVGSEPVESSCEEVNGVLTCTFKHKSLFKYTVSVVLSANQGEIDQILRPAGTVSCLLTE